MDALQNVFFLSLTPLREVRLVELCGYWCKCVGGEKEADGNKRKE